jgi:transposase-like protein
METMPLSEADLAEYCRKKGLYPEQVKRWKKTCQGANDLKNAQDKDLSQQIRQMKEQNKALERELDRKEKALAETAAILVLRKKVQAIWGDEVK